MASLIQEAEAARAQSRRLRGEMLELKVSLRESAGHSLEQRRTALESLDRVRVRRDSPLPSPWSTLRWSHDHSSLGDVLVPVR